MWCLVVDCQLHCRTRSNYFPLTLCDLMQWQWQEELQKKNEQIKLQLNSTDIKKRSMNRTIGYNMKLYAVVDIKNWGTLWKKKNLPFDTKELPLCFLNQCCSSIYIYIFMISRVLLLRGETAKRVKKKWITWLLWLTIIAMNSGEWFHPLWEVFLSFFRRSNVSTYFDTGLEMTSCYGHEIRLHKGLVRNYQGGRGVGILNLGSEMRWPIPAVGVKFANPSLDLGLKYHFSDPPPLV